ncbi:MAG TPA: glycosyltransferase [Gemmatimonadales bacterium]|nr:glycosyltransferase [Gemmatimonadales bacterium]
MTEQTPVPPLVSIIIPAYNAAATLAEAIDSALAQRYPRVEVVVVDDGSTDTTPEVLRRYGDRVRWVRQDNGGLPAARNTAHRHATGDLIAWLDADDLADPDRIALQVDLLARHPELVLVCSDFSAFRETGPVTPRFAATYYGQIAEKERGIDSLYPVRGTFTPSHPEWLHHSWGSVPFVRGRVESHMVWGNFVHPPTVLFRRALLERTGGLDPSAAPEADWEFFIRVSREGEIAHIDHPLLQYRLSPGQMSGPRNIRASLLGQAYVLRKHLPPHPRLPAPIRDLWRRRHALLYAGLARAEAETNSLSALGYLSLAAAHRHPPHSLVAILALIVLPVWAARGLLAGRRAMKRWLGQSGSSAHAPMLLACWLLQQAEWLPAVL